MLPPWKSPRRSPGHPPSRPCRHGPRETARLSAAPALTAPGLPVRGVVPQALHGKPEHLTSCCRRCSSMSASCIRACGANAIQLRIHTGTLKSYRPKCTRQQGPAPGVFWLVWGLPCRARRARPRVQAALVHPRPSCLGTDGFSLL